MKTRLELEAEAMRLIRVVNDNIVLDAKEVLVRALDQMQVDAMRGAADIAAHASNSVGTVHAQQAILTALENREKI